MSELPGKEHRGNPQGIHNSVLSESPEKTLIQVRHLRAEAKTLFAYSVLIWPGLSRWLNKYTC